MLLEVKWSSQDEHRGAFDVLDAGVITKTERRSEEMLAPDYSLVISTVPEHVFDRVNWLETAVGPYICTRLSYDGVQVRDLGAA